MLRQFELVEKVRSYDPDVDEDLLNRAYVFSMKAHGSQLRASGDPYFSHPIEVAGILTDMKLDAQTIATAILHDTIEDTVATTEQIEALFGPDIARLVDGVTKLSRLEAQSESERNAENFRKFVLALSDDIRVLLVKLADRLHNMRTLHYISKPEKRQRIARETLEIYAPLADRIGMYEMKDELNQLAFEQLEPEASQSITARLEQLRGRSGDLPPTVIADLQKELTRAGIEARIMGREKSPYSIWRKMQDRHIGFEQLSDIMGFRIIISASACGEGTANACYHALGLIHQRWKAVPQRFKDYISTPKRNGYRSLHTIVVMGGRDDLRVEIQIRTQEMHAEAELGLAAHWSYKQGMSERPEDGKAYPWVRDLLEILDHSAGAEEFFEHTKLAMYQDQVFCFTPRGEIIQLPKGATPVDFAYAVHTRLGDTTVGAKVNGRPVPLRTPLGNGDQVEVLLSSAQHPDPQWEAFVVTGKARSAIRRFVRSKEREDNLALGKRLLAATVEKLATPLSDTALQEALARLNQRDEESLYLALARHHINTDTLTEALVPGSLRKSSLPGHARGLDTVRALSIAGLTPGVVVHFAPCCTPVLGDRIVGVRQPGQGVVVHTIDCAALEKSDSSADPWLDLKWTADEGPTAIFVTRLKVVMHHEPGALATMATLIAQTNGNITNLQMIHRDRAFHSFYLDVEVKDVRHLTRLLGALRAARAISSVERMRGSEPGTPEGDLP